MHNTCISSTVSIRTKGSLSFSFSDYSYQWNERFEKSPSFQTTCCASCCSCCNHRVPINPSLLYGLRQSTLIQCPPTRRLVLVGGDRCYYRAPVYDIDRGSYGVSSCVKERIVGMSRGKRDNGRFDCRVSKGRRDWSHSGGDVEAEVMLSLLTEEVGDECFEVRKSDGGSFKRVQVEKKGNGGDQSYRRKKKNVESGSLRSNSKYEIESVAIESRNEGFRRKKKNVELDFLRSNSKDDNESVAIELRKEGYRKELRNVVSDSLRNNSKYENESVAIESSEEGYKRSEERKGLLRNENYRARKEGSSCSSYYSLSSSGDFERGDIESDTNLQITDVGDSSRQYKSDMRRAGEVRAEVVEEFESHRDDKEESVEVSKPQNTDVRSYAGGSNVEWDWRKKSEKKLTEELIDKTKCVKESSKEAFRVSGVQGSGSRNASVSDSEKQFDHREEKLRLGGNLDKETRKQYGQTGSEVIGQSISRINHPQVTEVSEIHGSNIQIISSSQKQYNGRGENVSAPANFVQEARKTTGKDEWAKKSQPLRSSETLDIDIETASNLRGQSEIRRKNQEGNTIYVLSSAGEAKKQHQTGEWATGQINSRRDTQQSSGVSEYRDNSYNKTSASHWQSEARMEIQEESSDLTSSSGPEAKLQHFHTDANDSWKTGQRKGSQDASSVSVVRVADTKNVTKTVSTSDKRTTVRESYLTSSMKSAEETGDKHNQTDERKTRIGSRKEARPSEVSSNHESTSEEVSSLQASINLVSQSRVQQISLQDSDKRSTQVLKPPPPRAKARESTAGLTAIEPFGEMEEQESDAIDTHQQGKTPESHDELYGGFQKAEIFEEPVNLISHEDALGSAARQEKSSMHFVGEFVEKVRLEVSTSEILKEKIFSELKSEYEGEKQMEKVVRYGSENIQLKEHESRHSSGVSGAKGPADEMWDVTGSSVQGTSKTEIPEGSATTGTAVVKRTGRSLWSIIADVVRMRWGSRSENHHSSVKSSKKSPSHESVSSESWYSGQELDEDKEKNINREKRSMLQESKSLDQLQPGKTSLKRQEGSNIMTGNDKITHVEANTSSSSGILQSTSVSLGVSLVSGEENSGESIRGSPSSSVIVESSLPLSSRQLRRSPAVELLGTGVADASESGSMGELELPLGASLTEVSGTEGKYGELKTRKLQRNKQVPKDRFDEWEEAYNRESEQRKIDEMFMREALLEAKKAADSWEVPVGAVLVQHGKIIARGCNLVEELRDSTAHAEMICIREASNVLRTWRLAETTLYVTLEPCPMCAGAIIQARIETVVWGAPNKLLGADGSWIRLFPNGEGANILDLNDKPPPPVHPFHPKMTIRRGVMAAECADAMQHFFQLRRRKKEKTPDLPTPPSRLPVLSHPTKFFSKMHHLFNVMFCL